MSTIVVPAEFVEPMASAARFRILDLGEEIQRLDPENADAWTSDLDGVRAALELLNAIEAGEPIACTDAADLSASVRCLSEPDTESSALANKIREWNLEVAA